MAYITTGLTNGGVTAHYKFSYDQALAAPSGPEPARTNAVIAACEADYNLMHGWFGGGVSVTGMSVQVTTQSNGAGWSGSASSSTIQLKAQGASYSNNSAYLRYLIIAEVVEIFMMAQNIGWFQGSNEGSKGEGLSRFLSGQFLAENGFLGLGMDADYAVADLWLNSSRQDFVNNAPDDNGYDATNGCTTLFIYYLFSQLGYGINQIVGAGASTLAGVYRNLTGDNTDPFPLFKGILRSLVPVADLLVGGRTQFRRPLPAARCRLFRRLALGKRSLLFVDRRRPEPLPQQMAGARQGKPAPERHRGDKPQWPTALFGHLGGRDGRLLSAGSTPTRRTSSPSGRRLRARICALSASAIMTGCGPGRGATDPTATTSGSTPTRRVSSPSGRRSPKRTCV